MADPLSIFERCVSYDPAGDFEALVKSVPAKWVVYLLADEGGKPIQLLCVKNLRYSLKRRLGGEEMTVGLSKRVDYREIVRRVYWRRVDSALEADWVYLVAARMLFPKSYQGMVGFRPAWFVHVDPAAEFPRYVKTTKVEGSGVGVQGSGIHIGPVEDKHAAHRLIELVEDSFDLCRYYNVLLEAPRGKACAYKEMGRCAAPCDGSSSMEKYRDDVSKSVGAIVRPAKFLRELEQQMRRAAGELKFEVAGKIKQRMEQVGQLGKGPFRHARRLSEFVYLSLQRGPREETGKLFLITPNGMDEVAGIVGEPGKVSDLLRHVLALASERGREAVTREGAEVLGLVSHHLFSPKQVQGVFLRLDEIDERSLAKAYKELAKQKVVEDKEEEGVVKELQEVERELG